MRTSECQHHRLPQWTAVPYSPAWTLACQYNSCTAKANVDGLITLHYSFSVLPENDLNTVCRSPRIRSHLRCEVPKERSMTD